MNNSTGSASKPAVPSFRLLFPSFLLVLAAIGCDDDESPDGATGGGGSGGAPATTTATAGSSTAATTSSAGTSSSTGSGSPDDDPQPAEIVIDGLEAPFAIAAGSTHIYWSDGWEETYGIVSCQPDDCESTKALLAGDQNIPARGLRYAAGALFWATGDGVFTCAAEACTPVTLHAGALDVTAITSDGTTTFYADDATDSIYRVTEGSPAALVASGVSDVRGITVDAGFVYFTTYGISANPPQSEILRCPTNGCTGAPEPIHGTTESLGAHGVAIAGGDVYWTEVARVRRCSTGGCTAAAEEIGPQSNATFEVLVTYDDRLAWSAYGVHFYSCERDDCAATSVAYDAGTTGQDLSLGESYVYVVASSMPGDGRIARIPR